MRSGGGVAKAKSLTEWGDAEGACSRTPYEDTQLKWVLEDGVMGRRMNNRCCGVGEAEAEKEGAEENDGAWGQRARVAAASTQSHGERSKESAALGRVFKSKNPHWARDLTQSFLFWLCGLQHFSLALDSSPCFYFILFCCFLWFSLLCLYSYYICSKKRTPNPQTALWNLTHLQLWCKLDHCK